MTAETLISPMPTYGQATNLLEHREALARRAAWRLEDASPQTIIKWAVLLMGRNSVRPCTRPRMTACR